MLGPQKPDGDVVFRVGGRFISGLEKFELQAPAGSAADIGSRASKNTRFRSAPPGGRRQQRAALDPTATSAARVRGVRYLIRQRTLGPGHAGAKIGAVLTRKRHRPSDYSATLSVRSYVTRRIA
jgi:hypothetical protein